MENKPKKSKALIITIIVILFLLMAGYLIFQNRDAFGVKTSNSIAKIFSPLLSLNKAKDLSTIDGQTGKITSPNTFLDSFSSFLGDVFNKKPVDTTPKVIPGSSLESLPQCSDDKDNDNDGFIDALDPNCHIDGDINKDYIPTHYSELNNPTEDDRRADLIAGDVTPINATVNISTTLFSTITNIGETSTEQGFSTFFEVSYSPETKNIELSVTTPLLPPKIENIATVLYNFKTVGKYQIRACADKSSSSDIGTIIESNENNNCGEWTTITATDSIPTEGACTNGADNPSICTTQNGACINGASNPPSCTITTCTNGATNPPECTILPIDDTDVNECLLIDKNPLVFTDEEKAELDELLRKFYLIAPNLKTEDDINIAYGEIAQAKNFSDRLSLLTQQCKEQTSSPTYKAAGGPTLKYGNPWYKYSQLRGSYIDSTFDCKYVSGWFSGNGADGRDCDTYNKRLYTAQTPASCAGSLYAGGYNHFTQAFVNPIILEGIKNNCTWNPGAYIHEMEKILNVW